MVIIHYRKLPVKIGLSSQFWIFNLSNMEALVRSTTSQMYLWFWSFHYSLPIRKLKIFYNWPAWFWCNWQFVSLTRSCSSLECVYLHLFYILLDCIAISWCIWIASFLPLSAISDIEFCFLLLLTVCICHPFLCHVNIFVYAIVDNFISNEIKLKLKHFMEFEEEKLSTCAVVEIN